MAGLGPLLLLIVLLAGCWSAAGAAGPPPATSGTSTAATGSDWDWSGFSGLDDAPVTDRSGRGGKSTGLPVAPKIGETAVPDFDAPARKTYALFRGMPSFDVIPSQRDPGMHPCSNCHQWVLSDPRPRKLKQPHDNFELQHGLHGKGKFWCFTCHELSGKGGLKTLEGEKLEFADAYVLCSQCHVDQARDWVYGAHGKRVSGWQDKRQVLNCTACHYQHRPALKTRTPEPGPRVRMGLGRPPHWVEKDKRPEADHVTRAAWKTEAVPDEKTGLESRPEGRRDSLVENSDDEKS